MPKKIPSGYSDLHHRQQRRVFFPLSIFVQPVHPVGVGGGPMATFTSTYNKQHITFMCLDEVVSQSFMCNNWNYPD